MPVGQKKKQYDKKRPLRARGRNGLSPNHYPTFFCCNACVCKYGFGETDCNSCKANFQLVSASDQENDSCVCPDGYIQSGQDTPDDPENDTCVINTNTTYNDSTGWFTVGPNGSSCNISGSWWQQQN